MFIHEALKMACGCNGTIYRKSWRWDAQLRPRHIRNPIMTVEKENSTARHWNPTAEELMADDWAVMPEDVRTTLENLQYDTSEKSTTTDDQSVRDRLSWIVPAVVSLITSVLVHLWIRGIL